MAALPPFLKIADQFADPVVPADFPKAILRYRNRVWDHAVGFGAVTDAAWAEQFSTFPPIEGNLA